MVDKAVVEMTPKMYLIFWVTIMSVCVISLTLCTYSLRSALLKRYSQSEYILAAAAKINGRVYFVPRPQRHNAVLANIHLIEKEPFKEEQGFITSTGRFVNRYEAGVIAVQCGQITKLQHPPQLYSEDLW